ncbi:hypothetical protein CPC08DRAFT_770440 [Agrocybe pediades]|nr:hypothetical protein CPC08DRAFT_770440 [Agrocybe pediades]
MVHPCTCLIVQRICTTKEGDPFDPFSSNANGNTNSNPIPSFHSITVSSFDSSRSWSGSPSAGGVDSVADSSNDNDHSGEESQNQEQTQPFPLSFYPSDSDLDFPNVNSTSYFDKFDANDDPTAGFANSNNYDSNYCTNSFNSSRPVTCDHRDEILNSSMVSRACDHPKFLLHFNPFGLQTDHLD